MFRHRPVSRDDLFLSPPTSSTAFSLLKGRFSPFRGTRGHAERVFGENEQQIQSKHHLLQLIRIHGLGNRSAHVTQLGKGNFEWKLRQSLVIKDGKKLFVLVLGIPRSVVEQKKSRAHSLCALLTLSKSRAKIPHKDPGKNATHDSKNGNSLFAQFPGSMMTMRRCIPHTALPRNC